MAKKPRARICRVVLEVGAEGATVPAIYVPKWWNFTALPFKWAWTRHSYILNLEAKAKSKVVSLYQQLLKTHTEAKAAESDNKLAVKEALAGVYRGWGPIKTLTLGDPEDLVTYDREAWDKVKKVVDQLASGALDTSRRSMRHGEPTSYILPGTEAAWNQAVKGDPTLEPTMKSRMTFRPPQEGQDRKGKDGKNQGGGGKGNTEIPVLLVGGQQGTSGQKDSSE